MRFFAILAIAAAVRLQSETTGPTAKQIFDTCDNNGDNVLDYKEVVACMNAHNIPENKQKEYGSQALKFAYIPKSNFGAVAKGVSAFTGGAVSVKAAAKEVKACNTDNDNKLTYGEVKACLKKNAKALGLDSKKRWAEAKWGLAKAAVINMKGLKAAMK